MSVDIYQTPQSLLATQADKLMELINAVKENSTYLITEQKKLWDRIENLKATLRQLQADYEALRSQEAKEIESANIAEKRLLEIKAALKTINNDRIRKEVKRVRSNSKSHE